VKRHLLQDRVVASKGRIDHGEIPLVREIEEVHLHFPTRLPVEDFCVPGNLGRYLQSAAQVRFLLAGDLRSDAKTNAPGSLVDCIGVEINFRRTRQRLVPRREGMKVWAAYAGSGFAINDETGRESIQITTRLFECRADLMIIR